MNIIRSIPVAVNIETLLDWIQGRIDNHRDEDINLSYFHIVRVLGYIRELEEDVETYRYHINKLKSSKVTNAH